jgi:hypothetical protein
MRRVSAFFNKVMTFVSAHPRAATLVILGETAFILLKHVL